MVDPRRLRQLLDRVSEEESHLRRLAAVDQQDLVADHDLMHAVKYGFVVAIEAALDAGRHVIASEGLAAPDTFAAVFAILAGNGLIDSSTASAMEDAARFRNLLVHQYATVDDRRVVEILATRLDDLTRFRQELARSTTDSRG